MQRSSAPFGNPFIQKKPDATPEQKKESHGKTLESYFNEKVKPLVNKLVSQKLLQEHPKDMTNIRAIITHYATQLSQTTFKSKSMLLLEKLLQRFGTLEQSYRPIAHTKIATSKPSALSGTASTLPPTRRPLAESKTSTSSYQEDRRFDLPNLVLAPLSRNEPFYRIFEEGQGGKHPLDSMFILDHTKSTPSPSSSVMPKFQARYHMSSDDMATLKPKGPLAPKASKEAHDIDLTQFTTREEFSAWRKKLDEKSPAAKAPTDSGAKIYTEIPKTPEDNTNCTIIFCDTMRGLVTSTQTFFGY